MLALGIFFVGGLNVGVWLLAAAVGAGQETCGYGGEDAERWFCSDVVRDGVGVAFYGLGSLFIALVLAAVLKKLAKPAP